MIDYTEYIRNRSPFIKLLGLAIENLDNGFCRSSLQIQDNFLNKHKFVHGGVIYSMADISMGVAVYSAIKKDEETATIEIKINYLKPAKTSILICDAKVIQKGKNIAVLEAEIKAEDILIAKAQGTFSIFRSKNDSAS
jgi:acyl-CoA thioesterase